MHRCHRLLSLLLALCLPHATDGNDQDWTRFRGPDGSGISTATTVPVEWTEQDYNWRVELPGTGHSSPVTWRDKVFVTCGEEKTARRIVLCLRAADGSVAWKRDFTSARHHLNPLNSYASSTPAVDGDRLYVYWTTPDAVAVAALDHGGKEVWRRALGAFHSEHGGGISPIVFGDMVVLANDQKGASSLVALDRTTGETRWQLARRSAKTAYSTPTVYRPDGAPPELIFTSMSHGITSVDPETGTVNWEFGDAFALRVVASPIVASGLIIGTCQVGGTGRRLVAVRPGSKARGTRPDVAWELKKRPPAVPVPVARDGLLYLWTCRGEVSCLRAAGGEQVWQGRIRDSFFGSPVWADGRLYCISRKGIVYVVAAGETYKLLATHPLGERSHATPAIGRGVMYLRTESHLIAIGGKR